MKPCPERITAYFGHSSPYIFSWKQRAEWGTQCPVVLCSSKVCKYLSACGFFFHSVKEREKSVCFCTWEKGGPTPLVGTVMQCDCASNFSSCFPPFEEITHRNKTYLQDLFFKAALHCTCNKVMTTALFARESLPTGPHSHADPKERKIVLKPSLGEKFLLILFLQC